MINDKLTDKNLSNLDKLNFYFNEKIKVHLLLKRVNDRGQNIFLNGFLINKLSETLFEVDEKILGKIRVSLFEIKEDGVEEWK